ncbi:hypothetical protein ACJX0J_011016, partial [Zea mays]
MPFGGGCQGNFEYRVKILEKLFDVKEWLNHEFCYLFLANLLELGTSNKLRRAAAHFLLKNLLLELSAASISPITFVIAFLFSLLYPEVSNGYKNDGDFDSKIQLNRISCRVPSSTVLYYIFIIQLDLPAETWSNL